MVRSCGVKVCILESGLPICTVARGLSPRLFVHARYGSVTSGTRPVRTRLPGGVGGGGESPRYPIVRQLIVFIPIRLVRQLG